MFFSSFLVTGVFAPWLRAVLISRLSYNNLTLCLGFPWRRRGVWVPLAVLVVFMPVPATATNAITGKPRVIDGETIEISGERIHLDGIDAPEAKQECTAGGTQWACGQEATFALARIIETHWVTCKGDKRDRDGRLIAVCHAGGKDINAMMVREGWALAYRRGSLDYVDEETAARDARRGLWRGESFRP